MQHMLNCVKVGSCHGVSMCSTCEWLLSAASESLGYETRPLHRAKKEMSEYGLEWQQPEHRKNMRWYWCLEFARQLLLSLQDTGRMRGCMWCERALCAVCEVPCGIHCGFQCCIVVRSCPNRTASNRASARRRPEKDTTRSGRTRWLEWKRKARSRSYMCVSTSRGTLSMISCGG